MTWGLSFLIESMNDSIVFFYFLPALSIFFLVRHFRENRARWFITAAVLGGLVGSSALHSHGSHDGCQVLEKAYVTVEGCTLSVHVYLANSGSIGHRYR